MSYTRLPIRAAKETDYPLIKTLLRQADLRIDDLRTDLDHFFVLEEQEQILGCGGIELYPPVALLRSLAITTTARGKGFGVLLHDHLEAYARQENIAELYLLTETAITFFKGRHYQTVERQHAPASIISTTQFSNLCPASASLMRKKLS